jgi:hypothetical protein
MYSRNLQRGVGIPPAGKEWGASWRENLEVGGGFAGQVGRLFPGQPVPHQLVHFPQAQRLEAVALGLTVRELEQEQGCRM